MASFDDDDRELFHIQSSKHSLNAMSGGHRDHSVSTEEEKTTFQDRECQSGFSKSRSTETAVCDWALSGSVRSKSAKKKESESLMEFLKSAESMMFGAESERDEEGQALPRGGGRRRERVSAPQSECTENGTTSIRRPQDRAMAVNVDGEQLVAQCQDINCDSSRLAVGFGARSGHISWCGHQGMAAIWNLKDSAAANEWVESTWCCSAIRYHPERSHLLSLGTFSGSISVLAPKDEVNAMEPVCRSAVGDCFHNEAVTELEWIRTEGPRQRSSFGLVSAAVDGKVLIWDFERDPDRDRAAMSGPALGFKLVSTAILRDPARPRVAAVSITNIAFADREGRCVLIATPCGAVLSATIGPLAALKSKKSLKSERGRASKHAAAREPVFGPAANRLIENIRSPPDRAEVKRNVLKYMALNKGIEAVALEHVFAANSDRARSAKLFPEIAAKMVVADKSRAATSALAVCPFSSSLFLRSSYRGDVQIHSLFHPLPVLDLDLAPNPISSTIHAAKWSPIRPTVIALLRRNELLIFDLLHRGHSAPALRLAISADPDAELRTLSFNKKGDTLCVSDCGGTLYVHRLPPVLTRFVPEEMDLIRSWVHGHDR